MVVQKNKSHDPYGADDEDLTNMEQLAAPVKSIEVIVRWLLALICFC